MSADRCCASRGLLLCDLRAGHEGPHKTVTEPPMGLPSSVTWTDPPPPPTDRKVPRLTGTERRCGRNDCTHGGPPYECDCMPLPSPPSGGAETGTRCPGCGAPLSSHPPRSPCEQAQLASARAEADRLRAEAASARAERQETEESAERPMAAQREQIDQQKRRAAAAESSRDCALEALRGLSACEKCWSDAFLASLKGPEDQAAAYQRLLRERRERPCTPEQQAGPDALPCAHCGGRRTRHQVTGLCMENPMHNRIAAAPESGGGGGTP